MDQPVGQGRRGDSISYDELLLALYRSISDTSPWSQFLALLCEELRGCAASLVLRQPARGDRGEMFYVNSHLSLLEIYRTTPFPDDPFLDLEEGAAASVFDRMSPDAFARSRYYNDLLRLAGDIDILALNVAFGAGYCGCLRISRRAPHALFNLADKSLLMRLYPHLKQALALYEHARRQHLENNAYVRAIDQLSFGVIILNERGHVVRVNERASRIMKDGRELKVVGNCLQAGDPANELVLAQAIAAILAGRPSPDSAHGSLKLDSDGEAALPLYLLLKPIHDFRGEPGKPAAGVALFLSTSQLQRSITIEPFARVHGLSPAERALVTELVDGVSIGEASAALGISENTARAQLRSVFSKTGTHRQTDLTRRVLTSLAIIA
jgi:DNA-binding CsgD family transcriptional regulator